MKLIQRVNYILLPVILGVFILSGLLAYEAFSRQLRNQFIESVERELDFLQREIDLELHAVHSALDQVLNSAELISFVTAPSPEYRVYAFESRLYQLLAKAKENSPGLQSFQLLGPEGQLLISADDADPFAVPTLASLPDSLLTDYLQTLGRGEYPGIREVIYQPDDGGLYLGIIRPFSSRLLLDDDLQQRDSGFYSAVLDSKINALERLSELLATEAGNAVSMRITDSLSVGGPALALGHQHLDDGGVAFVLRQPLYRIELTVGPDYFRTQTAQLRAMVALLAIGLTLLSFVALRVLISRQIVKPINRLAEKVKRSAAAEQVQLVPMNNNDEVAELNNAYLALVDDVQHLASFDSLTGLANRRSFQRWLGRQLPRVRQHGQQMALLYIDLDNFKRVNDHYGHATGDRLLKLFSQQLKTSIRPTDLAISVSDESMARLAGDEFAVLLSDVDGPGDAGAVAQRILQLFDNGFEVEQITHNVQASIGIAMMPDDGTEAQQLLRHADAAMYQAKAAGKNRFHFFSSALAAELQKRQRIEALLNEALAEGDFKLVYMPIFNAVDGKLTGAEVLLRCPRLAREGVGPDQFIPVAENTGLIKQIDLWVIEESLRRLKLLQQQLGYTGYMAINISAVELHNELFPGQVEKLLRQYRVDPRLIELEITETSMVSSDVDSIRILQRLRDLGLTLSLDDFGTGYTAFNQLASYPVDCLKIDRSFVNDMTHTTVNKQPMVNIMLALAKLYNLRVVAEGVETGQQLAYLQQSGCEQVQGYYLCKPLSWRQLKRRLGATSQYTVS